LSGAQAVLGMARKSSPFFNRSDPVLIEGALQNCFSTIRADCLQLALVPQLREHYVHEASDMNQQQDQHGAGDDIAGGPESSEAVRVIGCCGGWFSIVFLEAKKAAPDGAASGSFGH